MNLLCIQAILQYNAVIMFVIRQEMVIVLPIITHAIVPMIIGEIRVNNNIARIGNLNPHPPILMLYFLLMFVYVFSYFIFIFFFWIFDTKTKTNICKHIWFKHRTNVLMLQLVVAQLQQQEEIQTKFVIVAIILQAHIAKSLSITVAP